MTAKTYAHRMMLASDIPVAHTPPGGHGEVMPAPVFAGCTESPVPGAPDLRGTWHAVSVVVAGEPTEEPDP